MGSSHGDISPSCRIKESQKKWFQVTLGIVDFVIAISLFFRNGFLVIDIYSTD